MITALAFLFRLFSDPPVLPLEDLDLLDELLQLPLVLLPDRDGHVLLLTRALSDLRQLAPEDLQQYQGSFRDYKVRVAIYRTADNSDFWNDSGLINADNSDNYDN